MRSMVPVFVVAALFLGSSSIFAAEIPLAENTNLRTGDYSFGIFQNGQSPRAWIAGLVVCNAGVKESEYQGLSRNEWPVISFRLQPNGDSSSGSINIFDVATSQPKLVKITCSK